MSAGRTWVPLGGLWEARGSPGKPGKTLEDPLGGPSEALGRSQEARETPGRLREAPGKPREALCKNKEILKIILKSPPLGSLRYFNYL